MTPDQTAALIAVQRYSGRDIAGLGGFVGRYHSAPGEPDWTVGRLATALVELQALGMIGGDWGITPEGRAELQASGADRAAGPL